MMSIGYFACLIISILALFYMARKNYEHVNIYFWTIICVMPVILLAYWLQTLVTTAEEAKLAYCFIYLDSTVLLTLTLFTMMHFLGIHPPKWVKISAYGIAFLHMLLVWLCLNNTLYYSTVTIVQTDFGTATMVTDGPIKFVHYIYIGIILLSIAILLITAYFRKGTYSRRSLLIFVVIATVGILAYIVETAVRSPFTTLPYLYAATQVLVVLDYDYLNSHDITSVISVHYDSNSERGYFTVSLNNKYLGSNRKSHEFLPFLDHQRVDADLDETDGNAQLILQLIDDFKAGDATNTEFKAGEKTCVCDISYFSLRHNAQPQGYLLDIRDATEEKQNLEILTNYNQKLNEDVEEKTAHIRSIQNKVVLGMANMVENRDGSTGGHIKRTSDVIRILVDEIRKQGKLDIDDQLAEDIVRAAPMHDLGKLHIDSNILCKLGKLTPEEYEIMKTHSTKSGEMVMILLDGVEEESFVKVAYNVARYHHERWDGRGYPEGLVGGMIPLEARIMAVADVYDALVSKRCYKEPMSFEKAAAIMNEGMGTQFDPNMKQIFLGCHEKMEDYYRNLNS